MSAGPHRDGRFESVGDLIRHIFSAEKRYVDRFAGRPVTDPAGIPTGDAGALFAFGQQSRADLRDFVDRFPAEEWDTMLELSLMGSVLHATARKIVGHILLHEIRHWAQIQTILRLGGLATEMQDILFSPALGGEIIRTTPTQ